MDRKNKIIAEGLKEKLFPLHTVQSLANRWGVRPNVVSNWAARHSNFPRAIIGVVHPTKGRGLYYPLYEVERYERERQDLPRC